METDRMGNKRSDAMEKSFERGMECAWLLMLHTCLEKLGYHNAVAKHTAWVVEREEAIAKLRELCEEHGDNDWENDLHLADIIEKHIRF